MKTIYLLLLLTSCLCLSAIGPLKVKSGHSTDYNYYCNKYSDLWQPYDTSRVYNDTLYIYRLCGQYFTFNQSGDLIINKH